MSIEKGELSSIIGPNGPGKSTLFNLITGYLPPDSGKILFQGEDEYFEGIAPDRWHSNYKGKINLIADPGAIFRHIIGLTGRESVR